MPHRATRRSGFTRRAFLQVAIAGATGLLRPPPPVQAATPRAFSFVLLGDLHFDKLGHHDLAWLEKDKPDDLRQVRDYTRLTTEILPKLFATVRKTIAELRPSPEPRVACAVQVGDFVEGLCGSEALAVQ